MNMLITPPHLPVLTLGTKKNPTEELLLTQVCVPHREGPEQEVVFSCRSIYLSWTRIWEMWMQQMVKDQAAGQKQQVAENQSILAD